VSKPKINPRSTFSVVLRQIAEGTSVEVEKPYVLGQNLRYLEDRIEMAPLEDKNKLIIVPLNNVAFIRED